MAELNRTSRVAASTALGLALALAPAALHDSSASSASASIEDARFTGKDRKEAKTSIVSDDDIDEYSSVADLIADLPDDDSMMFYEPQIKRTGAGSRRVEEERENVRLTAFLYAAKYESDGDFHLILGDQGGDPAYLNCEISGLPSKSSKHFAKLRTARHAFIDVLRDAGKGTPGKSKYTHYAPPLKVELLGSLFYDIDHAPGTVGPAKRRPDTAWEIHPIASIEAVDH